MLVEAHSWLVVSTPLKKYEFVSWDYEDLPTLMESHKRHVPKHQALFTLK